MRWGLRCNVCGWTVNVRVGVRSSEIHAGHGLEAGHEEWNSSCPVDIAADVADASEALVQRGRDFEAGFAKGAQYTTKLARDLVLGALGKLL